MSFLLAEIEERSFYLNLEIHGLWVRVSCLRWDSLIHIMKILYFFEKYCRQKLIWYSGIIMSVYLTAHILSSHLTLSPGKSTNQQWRGILETNTWHKGCLWQEKVRWIWTKVIWPMSRSPKELEILWSLLNVEKFEMTILPFCMILDADLMMHMQV